VGDERGVGVGGDRTGEDGVDAYRVVEPSE
jgi:hypothetical protein